MLESATTYKGQVDVSSAIYLAANNERTSFYRYFHGFCQPGGISDSEEGSFEFELPLVTLVHMMRLTI